MDSLLKTIVKSTKDKKEIFHYFLPALSLKIALENGFEVDKKIIQIIERELNKNSKNDYFRFVKEKPFDYDSTIISRDIFQLLNKKISNELVLSLTQEGGIYTYVGGLKTYDKNSIDILINIIVLGYLLKNKIYSEETKKIISFLLKKKDLFYKDIRFISKYYLSRGYFVYCLSKVARVLDVNIDKIIKIKLKKIKNKTDLSFMLLASKRLNKELVNKFEIAENKPLFLFQYPNKKLKYSCPLFDEIVVKCAEEKIESYISNRFLI